MSRQTQLSFKHAPAFRKHFRTEHGGSLYKGRRKETRPLASKRPMHVVFRSSRARGAWSFLHSDNRASVEKLARDTAYTRVVRWGREFIALRRYLLRNDLEAVGFLGHNERSLNFAEALARRGLRLV